MNFKKILSTAVILIFAVPLTLLTASSSTVRLKNKPLPPSPAESPDPNAVTFDDDDFSFAYIQDKDPDSASGKLEIAEIQGNRMLRFNDDLSVERKGKVQKIIINAAMLIGTENLPRVRSIEFDMYADAVTDDYVNQDGKNVKAPGTINGGGGTVTAKTDSEGNGIWYDFEEFEGGEYNFAMSGAIHAEFKFLLASGGVCWSSEMEDANFLIMRWGSENDSNLYIDNIVFYDENGKSIPLLDQTGF